MCAPCRHRLLGVALTLTLLSAAGAAWGQETSTTFPPARAPQFAATDEVLHPEALLRPMLALVVAAALGGVLAFRPRRPGGPPRTAHVVQTQIMLSIVGSLVMLIVGASLARAFGIAGAASLVRYRAKIDDPKDASVMLACLAIGLATGVGLFLMAAVGTAFIVAVLWTLEWREPWPKKPFELKVSAKDPSALKAGVEGLLKQHRLSFELRGDTDKEIVYMVEMPQNRKTDKLSEAITKLEQEGVNVEWSEKKPK
jgi:uncharacterized membrane protein YhiD involved in acid resistance